MSIVAPFLVPDLETCALLLDVDGTILDIASTPWEVRVPSSLRRAMNRLGERTGGALALVSGRLVSDLDLLFAPLELPAVGGHGAEIRPVPGASLDFRRAHPLDAKLKRKFAAIAESDSSILIEDKGYSVALHYRLAPELGDAVNQAAVRICLENPSVSIELLRGKSVVEIKQAGLSKATGVRELMRYPPFRGRRPIFIGDDVTDESVFEIIGEFEGLAFSVGRIASGVDGHFENPEAVRAWLARISGDGESATP